MSEMLFKRIKDWVVSITSFRTGDVIPVDGPSGTAKMAKNDLLKETAQNALAGNVAPEFDPSRDEDHKYLVGERVMYQGKLYRFFKEHYGVWSGDDVEAISEESDFDAFKTDLARRDETSLVCIFDGKSIIKQSSSYVITTNYNNYSVNLYKLNNARMLSVTGRIGDVVYIVFYDSDFAVVKAVKGRAVSGTSNNFNDVGIAVPFSSKYVAVSYATENGLVLKTLSNKIVEKSYSSVPPILMEVKEGAYISSAGVVTNYTGYNVHSLYLEGISKFYIKAKIGVVSAIVFYDINDSIVSSISGRSVADASKPNFDEELDVPVNCVYAKIGAGESPSPIFESSEFINRVKSVEDKFLSGKKVAFIGDSITAGYGAGSEENRYVNRFGAMTGAEVVNLGVNGTCIANNTKNNLGSQRFVTRATSANLSDVDLVVVFGGTNDLSYDSKAIGEHFTETTITASGNIGTKQLGPVSDTDTFAGALHDLITTIQANVAANTPVLFLTPLHRNNNAETNPNSYQCNSNGDFMKDFVNAIKDICGFYSIPVLDMYGDAQLNPLVDNYSGLFSDGLHPNASGHQVIAERIASFVKNNISFIS